MREKLIKLYEEHEVLEGKPLSVLDNLPEIKLVNDFLAYVMEDEALFWGGITIDEMNEILDKQYNAETLEQHKCFMFYDKEHHTCQSIEELKERFKEAYDWVKAKD